MKANKETLKQLVNALDVAIAFYTNKNTYLEKKAANARPVLKELMEYVERLEDEIDHLKRCKEFESNLQMEVLEAGIKYVDAPEESTIYTTRPWGAIKQTLTGGNDVNQENLNQSDSTPLKDTGEE